MKHLILYATAILCYLSTIPCFSQTVYKVDEQRTYSSNNGIANPDWQHDITLQYTYGNEGNKETNLLILTSSLEKLSQFNSKYNANNDIILNEIQSWNNGIMQWQDASKITYDYDGVNNLIGETTQIYVSMSPQYSSKIEYEYDGSNKLIRETTLYYDTGSMTFVKTLSSSQELYEYSGSDITKHTIQSSLAGPDWFDEEIIETNYTSPGIQSSYLESSWNGTSYDIEKGTFTYNMGLITKVVYDIPNGVGGWDFNGQSLIEYSGTLIKKITQEDKDGINEFKEEYDYDANGNIKVFTEATWDESIPDWVPDYKIEKDYSVALPFVLSSESFEIENFKIYPNPASSVINVSSQRTIDRIEMFDVLGKKVLSTFENKQINIENLKSGVYFLKAFKEKNSTTKKVVIK